MSEETPKIPFNEDSLIIEMNALYINAIEDYIEENNTEEAYEEMLDDVYGEVSICGMNYSAGRALKELDPIAFNVGMSDNEDSIRERAEEEIDEDDFRDEALQVLNMEEEES